ncbi:Phosphoglycerate kinase, chloroplastic [Galdieria sulphuraria]|nr:Phosphoglycerate kinase, chloroplastic [Galdieria sulphuraria]
MTTATSSKKKSLKDLSAADLKGKRVLVRCDLNVPLDGKSITDDTRIKASLPTIQYLINHGAKVILSSHLGRPKGGFEDRYSLAPVAERLGQLLGKSVRMAPDCIGDQVNNMVLAMNDGDIILLENVRFYTEETDNDPDFSRKLSMNMDLYVNDAFGSAHRAHASTEGVTQFIRPAVAGFLLEKELEYLQNAIQNPERPFAAIIGGSKVSSKIGVLKSLIEKCDVIIIGGEEDKLYLAKEIEQMAAQKKVELIFPLDLLVADKFDNHANVKTVSFSQIEEGWMGLDIGPATIEMIESALAKCKTILWNGPMGVFEMENFARGTFQVARILAKLTEQGAITIIGGGDSVAAVEKANLADKMSHISTGGGASLELIEGRVLPGVAALDDA